MKVGEERWLGEGGWRLKRRMTWMILTSSKFNSVSDVFPTQSDLFGRNTHAGSSTRWEHVQVNGCVTTASRIHSFTFWLHEYRIHPLSLEEDESEFDDVSDIGSFGDVCCNDWSSEHGSGASGAERKRVRVHLRPGWSELPLPRSPTFRLPRNTALDWLN